MTTLQTSTPTSVLTPTGRRTVPATLRLVEDLPGLPGRRTYSLEPLDDLGVLFALRSTPEDGPQVRLFVVAPCAFFPGYTPRLPADTPGFLPDADPLLLVVVRSSDAAGRPPTANLLAPLMVDTTGGTAVQVVLDEDYPLRAAVG